MMAMVNDKPTPKWRNFAAWSAVGAILYILAAWGGSSLLHEDGTGAMFRSEEVVAKVGLGLLFAMAWVGFTSRNRPLSLMSFRNFVVLSAVAVVVCLLLVWGFRASVGAGPMGAMGASAWAATGVGMALIVVAILGMLGVAMANRGGHFMDADVADELRDRGRLHVYSWISVAAIGLALVLLSLAGPAGVLSPAAALAGALILFGVATILSITLWRLIDELDRTLSHEAGNMAFHLIVLLGGGWAMLAHLGLVPGAAPLDWLTMFTVLLVAATFIAMGRRRLLTR